tara:strand:+ start:36 stop:320 length:285 start_codon:yes stop_codon:yes gene_type:complete
MELSCFKYKRINSLDNTFFKMKESKLLDMQRKVEILAAALKKALVRLDNLQEFTQGILTSFQIHIGKDEWEKIVEQLKDINKRENVEQPVEKGS